VSDTLQDLRADMARRLEELGAYEQEAARLRRALDVLDEPSPSTTTADITLIEEIRRVDDLACTVFEVLMALGAAAVAIAFTVHVFAVQVAAGLAGFAVAIGAAFVVPDIVFAHGENDRSDSSLRRYLKRRQRITQGAIVILLILVVVGLYAAFDVAVSDAVHNGFATGGVAVFAACVAAFALRRRESDIWPHDIRNPEPHMRWYRRYARRQWRRSGPASR
jgi:hypothetical protein